MRHVGLRRVVPRGQSGRRDREIQTLGYLSGWSVSVPCRLDGRLTNLLRVVQEPDSFLDDKWSLRIGVSQHSRDVWINVAFVFVIWARVPAAQPSPGDHH